MIDYVHLSLTIKLRRNILHPQMWHENKFADGEPYFYHGLRGVRIFYYGGTADNGRIPARRREAYVVNLMGNAVASCCSQSASATAMKALPQNARNDLSTQNPHRKRQGFAGGFDWFYIVDTEKFFRYHVTKRYFVCLNYVAPTCNEMRNSIIW